MFFSKSFGYAVRGILFVALKSDEKHKIRIDEIAMRLSVPRHFLGKIMKKLVKENILSSTKGPYGGFYLNGQTLDTPVLRIVEITDGSQHFKNCILNYRECDPLSPCPLHHRIQPYRNNLQHLFAHTTIGELLRGDNNEFIRGISTLYPEQ